MKNLREKLEAMGWSFVGRNNSDVIEFNGYPEEVDSKATLELVSNGYIEEYNYIDSDTCEEEIMLILKIYPTFKKVKKITRVDTISAAIKRNDEETIIRQEIEAAAEEGILNEQELEELQEEMLDDLYQKQQEDANKRAHAYTVIAENLWNAAYEALQEGNLAESMAIGDVYNSWVDICIKKGVL